MDSFPRPICSSFAKGGCVFLSLEGSGVYNFKIPQIRILKIIYRGSFCPFSGRKIVFSQQKHIRFQATGKLILHTKCQVSTTKSVADQLCTDTQTDTKTDCKKHENWRTCPRDVAMCGFIFTWSRVAQQIHIKIIMLVVLEVITEQGF